MQLMLEGKRGTVYIERKKRNVNLDLVDSKLKGFVCVQDWLDLTSPTELYHDGALSDNLIPKDKLFAVMRLHRLLTEV